MKRTVLLLLISAALTSACTSAKWVRTTVAKGYEFNVTLEQRQEKGAVVPQKYSHPYAMDISALEKLMQELKYVEKGGLTSAEKQSPVFQSAEIVRLAPALAEALTKADADQRVRFTSFNQGKALIFSVPRKTEGVMFVETAGRLNLAFNLINAKRQPSEATAVAPVYSTADPLRIKASDTPLAATAPYAKLHEFATGERAPLWVVADLEELKQATAAAPAPVVKAEPAAAPAEAPLAGTEGTPADKSAADRAPEEMPTGEIKNKLKFLKELLDEGLISEEDYAGKKMELLERIQ